MVNISRGSFRRDALNALLACGSALFVAGAASAADLPSRKAGPVSYVKICDAYGAGYFSLPGSDTCVRVAGYVRAEWQYTPGQRMFSVATGALTQVGGSQDTTGVESRGVVQLDARTPTEFGTVRTNLRLRAAASSGIRRQGSAGNFATTYPGGNQPQNAGITLERAYIEWAGFKFGNMSTEWNNWPSGTIVGFLGDFVAGWTNGVKAISYTKKFGGGWTAIVSIEDRDSQPHDQNTLVTLAGMPVPTSSISTSRHDLLTGFNLVGVLRLEQNWGSAQISGMVANNSTTDGPTPFATGGNANPLLGTKHYGSWAVSPTVSIKLPMIAAGDELWLNAAYGVGAFGYVAGDAFNTLQSNSSNRRVIGGITIDPSNLIVTNANAAGAPLTWSSTRAWMGMAMFTHFWTPQLRSHMSAGYLKYETPTANNPNLLVRNVQVGDSSMWMVKSNLIYSPVKDFDIGIEAAYGKMNATIQNPTAAYIAAGQPGLKEGNWSTKFRVQRGF